ncbi:ABC transporter ATP-binding protein (plasmid) [Mycoplasmopsis gallopavonis]|uniref:ABC transporter ATP-binding protein n=1 Tax=Mycoplasmopsis gallopavonis TaxID=76629 RepID=A0A449B0D9_9BACT|nr:ABC transporter ATP-binding protein [Mycoplasmopsis gallopavonis]VEU73204.1 ABC transporter ATP-binding protein [Mycoplasmopsis gallopavonis]
MSYYKIISKKQPSFWALIFWILIKSALVVFASWLFLQIIEALSDNLRSDSIYYLLGLFGVEIVVICLLIVVERIKIKFMQVGTVNLRSELLHRQSLFHPREFKLNSSEKFVGVLDVDANNLVVSYVFIFNFIESLSLIVGFTIFYAILSWKMTLIFWGLSIFKLLANLLITKMSAKFDVKSNQVEHQIYQKAARYVVGFTTFAFANKRELIASLFVKDLSSEYKKISQYKIVGGFWELFSKFIEWLNFGVVLVLSLVFYQKDFITLPLLILFITKYAEFDQTIGSLKTAARTGWGYLDLAKRITAFYQQFEIKNQLPLLDFESLKMENISFKYDETQILENFNWQIHKNQKYLIQGQSGSGKTTITNILTNLIWDYEGQVLVNGQVINKNDDLSKNIGILNHEILLPEKISSDYWTQKEVQNLLIPFHIDFVNFEETLITEQLSLGQKQRLQLLDLFAKNKNIYILDESLSNLNPELRHSIFEYLINLNATIIFISHHMEASQIAQFDHVLSLT